MARLFSFGIDTPVEVQITRGVLGNGKFYLVLSLNVGDVSIILPGENAEAITAAREIAAMLTDAADALENTLRLARRRSEGFSEAAEQDAADSRD